MDGDRIAVEVLAATPAITLTPIDGGWRIKTTVDGRYHVDVMAMMFGYRVVRTPVVAPYYYDRHWCYVTTGPVTLLLAVLAANAWDGADDTEPDGWNKNGQTGEWREPA